MTAPDIPHELRALLADSPAEPGILELNAQVGEILRDNKLPFFPAFTDHGAEHVARVMRTATRLVPAAVWQAKLLQPADAAVLIGACLFHDLAMHLREPGFVELVSEDDFDPVPWFVRQQGARLPDQRWPALWQAFKREARHFSRSELDRILGPDNCGVPAVAHDAVLDPHAWLPEDYLLIGEFLRRHHARLGHEMALQGLPGDRGLVKAIDPELANAIGVVARSHGEPMRRMSEYVRFMYGTNLQPAGAVLLFHMGLIRVADYLQIDSDRAPALLLRLREPASRQSIAEWEVHGAVSTISWRDADGEAISVTVRPTPGVRTFLQLRRLFNGLQEEMDATGAILSETYGGDDELRELRLAKTRVRTNLDSVGLHERLSFVPREAILRSGDDLFRLVVRQLYGSQPAVGGRELLQNAVDAVRERRRLSLEDPAVGSSERGPAVLVAVEETGDDQYVLRVTDRGVGMSPDTVADYFLKAGASFGPTFAQREDLEPGEASKTLKAGRFGIGALAAFLLGPEMHVTTRHVNAERGVSMTVRMDDDLVEMSWIDAPAGTDIDVPFSGRSLPRFNELREKAGLELLTEIATLYWLEEPTVRFEYVTREGARMHVPQVVNVPAPDQPLPGDWREFDAPGFDRLLWRLPPPGHTTTGGIAFQGLAHNGIAIRGPGRRPSTKSPYSWSRPIHSGIDTPVLSVSDSRHLLPIALHRYALVDKTLPFEDELLESIGMDVLAHALARGPKTHPLLNVYVARSAGLFVAAVGGLPSVLAEHQVVAILVPDPMEVAESVMAEIRATSPEFTWTLTHRFDGAVWKTFSRSGFASEVERLAPHLGTPLASLFDYQRRGAHTATASFEPVQNPTLPGFRLYPSTDGTRGLDLQRLLQRALQVFLSSYPATPVGLAVFRAGHRSMSDVDDPITRPWRTILGRAAAIDFNQRQQQTAAAVAACPKLGPLVDIWRRRDTQ